METRAGRILKIADYTLQFFSRGLFIIRWFTKLFCNAELMLMLGLE
jgi:hypothetical protein